MSMAHVNEEWRAIPGTDGRYEASSLGRIRSLWNAGGKGARRLRTEPKVLKPYLSKHNGYFNCRFAKSGPTLTVHKLVLLAFSGPAPEGKPCVGHKDGDRANNRSDNLEWVSYSENNGRDRHRHGTALTGATNHQAKLTDDGVRLMRMLRAQGAKYSELSREFAVSVPVVAAVIHRRTWRHVA